MTELKLKVYISSKVETSCEKGWDLTLHRTCPINHPLSNFVVSLFENRRPRPSICTSSNKLAFRVPAFVRLVSFSNTSLKFHLRL